MKKFEKIFFSMIAMIMMVAVGSVFTSCTNDDDDFRVPAQETQLDQALDLDSVAPMTRGMNATWYPVTNTIKDRYYSGFNSATNNTPSNAYNNPVHVGFYSAYNATYNASNSYSSTLNNLYDLYSLNSSYTYYKGYPSSNNTSLTDFTNHIYDFLRYKHKPVVVLASTQNITSDILIVWAASTSGVRVTRISDGAQSDFGNNNIIELTWQSFYNKAIAASGSSIANVAYMNSSIYGVTGLILERSFLFLSFYYRFLENILVYCIDICIFFWSGRFYIFTIKKMKKKILLGLFVISIIPSFSLATSLENRCNLDGGKVFDGGNFFGNICMFDLNETLLGSAGNNFCSLGNYFNGNCKRPENKDFSQEMIAAYNWSYSKGITTMETIKQANTDKEITRAELAKMISNYAKNVLGRTPDTTKACLFLNSNVSADLVQYMTESCQLGLMGQGITDFRPNDSVTRAEFGTVLSRMLFNTEDGKDKYYSTHLAKLKSEGIITNDNPDLKELRGFVMLMLMRSENNYKGELTIIGPNNGFDDRIKQGELVLRGNFEDHTDYIFFASGNWQNYLYKDFVYPGEKVKFEGKVKSIDGAAGSHYYEAESIYKLEDNIEGDVHLCRGMYDIKDVEGESCDENIKSVVCADDGKEYVNSDCACMNPSIYSFTFGKCSD